MVFDPGLPARFSDGVIIGSFVEQSFAVHDVSSGSLASERGLSDLPWSIESCVFFRTVFNASFARLSCSFPMPTGGEPGSGHSDRLSKFEVSLDMRRSFCAFFQLPDGIPDPRVFVLVFSEEFFAGEVSSFSSISVRISAIFFGVVKS